MPELRLDEKTREEAKTSTFAAAEKVLALAESLEQRGEQHDAQSIRYELIILISIFLLTLLVPILTALQAGNLISDGMKAGALVAVVLQAGIAVLYSWMRFHRACQMRDSVRRMMQRLIDMLREIEGAFALDESVSVLERVAFQTRLARFPIGPSTRPSQNGVPR